MFWNFLQSTVILLTITSVSFAQDISKSISTLRKNKNFVQVQAGNGFKIDLKYATTDNFVHQNMYGDFKECWLEESAAKKITVALQNLRLQKPRWGFVFYDCLRPRSVQRIMWAKVVGTENQMYVGDPDKGSVHNFGLAVDLGLIDENGKEVDMGSAFDSFALVSQPKLEEKFLKEGSLTSTQVQNRRTLRSAMEGAGFIQLPHEWWHYDSVYSKDLKKFQIVE